MFFIGIFTACVAILIDIGIDQISKFRYSVIRNSILWVVVVCYIRVYCGYRWVVCLTISPAIDHAVDDNTLYMIPIAWVSSGVLLVMVAAIMVVWLEVNSLCVCCVLCVLCNLRISSESVATNNLIFSICWNLIDGVHSVLWTIQCI